ncbi:cyclin-T2 isoform X1 [Sesbania bispinosa]|nr:cyclin-T2 isoform X1 [Sesbania bispinosa]
MVSYKDICLGVNGHNLSEEDVELFEVFQESGAEDKGDNAVEGSSFLGDPLCPIEQRNDTHAQNASTSVPPVAGSPTEDSSFGPWMLAQKPQRHLGRNSSGNGGVKSGVPISKGTKGDESVSLEKISDGKNVRRTESATGGLGSITHTEVVVSGNHKKVRKESTSNNEATKFKGVDSHNTVTTDYMSPTILERGTRVQEGMSTKKGSWPFNSLSGPGRRNKNQVGLNLKSQVKFKNVKQATRNVGERVGLPLTIVSTPTFNSDLAQHHSDPLGGSDDALRMGKVEIFNHRPPNLSVMDDTHGELVTQPVSLGDDVCAVNMDAVESSSLDASSLSCH